MIARRRLALAALALLVAGCALFESPEEKAMRNSPSFKAGYEDGCAAETAAGTDYRDRPVMDKSLYESDAAYRSGWSSGRQACRRTPLPSSATPGANPIPGTP